MSRDRFDDNDRRALGIIREHGCMVVNIKEDEHTPAFAYTIGLNQNFSHPEVVMIGLQGNVMHGVLKRIRDDLRGGLRRFDVAGRCADLLEGYDCEFRAVHRSHYPGYLGWGTHLQGLSFPALQCVWPGKSGLFPWDAGRPEIVAARQPMLDRPWPFPGMMVTQKVFTLRRIMSGGEPVLTVWREAEDEW